MGIEQVNAGPVTQRAEPVRSPGPSLVVQRKLAVGASDDPLEAEADRAADDVMRILRSLSADASSPPTAGQGGPTRIRRHASAEHHHHDDSTPEVGMAGGEISGELSNRIAGASGGKRLPDSTLARMEHGFGASFESVRVHADSDLPQQVAADAFTTGSDVHFAPGLYDPSSQSGERLLAHELAHVVQQGGSKIARHHVCSSSCGHGGSPAPEGGSRVVRRHVCSPGCGHDEGGRRTVGESRVVRRHVCAPGCGHDGPSALTDDGPQLAHELLHMMGRPPQLSRSTKADTTRMIRRHASWEHKMLGDVDPSTLEIIAKGRDEAAKAKAKPKTVDVPEDEVELATLGDGDEEINLDTVLHTIDQEIARLKFFQSHPPMGTVKQATAQLEQLDNTRRMDEIGVVENREAAEQEVNDTKWGVRLVSLKLKDNTTFLVTYGEMNTLADFYGSAEEIAQTPAANFKGIVGGVREESIRKFMRLRNELTIKGDKKYKPDSADHNIEGAIGNKGTLNGAGVASAVLNIDQFGELKLMNEMNGSNGSEKREEIDGRAETSYTAGLARNACHFAPQSWHSWAAAHNKAINLATQAWTLNQRAATLEGQAKDLKERPSEVDVSETVRQKTQEAEVLRDQADDKLNDALIQNGFGDHFLQDSYAAGHLVNKTLIMQWFVTWLDKNWNKRNYTKDDDWRQVQQMAYGQKGAKDQGDISGRGLYDKSTVGQAQSNDPQSVENMSGEWTDRFDALGLKVPKVLTDRNSTEFKVFTWWQGQAMEGNLLKADKGDLEKTPGCPVKSKSLEVALKKLIDAGVVYYAKYSSSDRGKGAEEIGLGNFMYNKSLSIKREYIPKDKVRFRAAMVDINTGDTAKYDKMTKAVTLNDYHKFLNHGYVQLASNVLHDHFCKNGLKVATKSDDEPYVIYGDNAMLGKESDKMVKYSAETSHQSRDSIYDIASTGDTAYKTNLIADRFPSFVRPVGASVNLSLADWSGENGSLHKFCFDKIFPDDVAALFSKSTAIAKDALTGKVSKDADVHTGEAF